MAAAEPGKKELITDHQCDVIMAGRQLASAWLSASPEHVSIRVCIYINTFEPYTAPNVSPPPPEVEPPSPKIIAPPNIVPFYIGRGVGY